MDLYFQSCVAMASGHFNIWTIYLLSPWQHPPRHVNRVLLPKGQLGRGLKLVGGRGYGVFIHSHRHTSRGLQTGDQVTKVTLPSTKDCHQFVQSPAQQFLLSVFTGLQLVEDGGLGRLLKSWWPLSPLVCIALESPTTQDTWLASIVSYSCQGVATLVQS